MSRIDEALRRFPSGQESPAPYLPPAPPRPQPFRVREGQASGDSDELDLRELLWVLYRKKWHIALVAIAVVVPVAVVNFLMQPLYRSTVTLQIDPEPVQVLPFKEVDRPTVNPGYELFLKSQEELLRGQTLVTRVAERLDATLDQTLGAEIPLLWERRTVGRLPATQLIHLSYVGATSDAAARIANLFAEEFIKLHFETRQRTREDARTLLERELANLAARVQVSEVELLKYSQEHGIPSGGPDKGLIPTKLTSLEQQLTAAEAEMFVAKARLDPLRGASSTSFPDRLVTPSISGLTGQLLQLESNLASLRVSFGENWPEVVRLRGQVELVKAQLEREKSAALSQALQAANLDYQTAENRRNMVAAALKEQENLNLQLQNAGIQYNMLLRDVETNQKMYDGVLERLQQSSLTAGMEFGGLHIVEPAVPSEVVDSPKILWNVSLAALLGLALGVCVVIGSHYWDTSIRTLEEAERVTALPVLGALPAIRGAIGHFQPPANGHKQLKDGTDGATAALSLRPEPAPGASLTANHEVAEGVRNVVASILLSRSGRPPRVLVVTSSVQGEGKTTLACELGWALAEGGAKTLLIEGDLRRPTFASRFGVSGEGGLSLFLSGNLETNPAIHPTGHHNLSIVTAGPSAPNPAALLGSAKMQGYLRQLLSSFQFVIVDSPPVLPIADARLLARLAEGVVLVVRAGKVPRALVRRVSHALEGSGASLLGVVLNGADLAGHESSYYHPAYLEYQR